MKNKNKMTRRLLILVLLTFTYIFCYLFFLYSRSVDTQDQVEYIPLERPEYEKVVIRAKEFTKILKDTPYQLVSRDRKLNLKNIFIIEKLEDDFDDSARYLVDLPKKYISKVVGLSDLELYSNTIIFDKPKKRKAYEIHY